jgi:hypothetical protein
MVILDETDFPEGISISAINQVLKEVDDLMNNDLDAVYYDHASLFKFTSSSNKNISLGEVINTFISAIRKLSIRFRQDKEGNWRQLASVVLIQANRHGYQRAVKTGRYSLLAISESNEVERASFFITLPNHLLFWYHDQNTHY